MINKILYRMKYKIRALLKKAAGIDEIERRITRLEELTVNNDVGMQIENGLRYLEHIRTAPNLVTDENQE